MNFQQFSESHILTILPVIIGIWVVVGFIVVRFVRDVASLSWLGVTGVILTTLALLITPSEGSPTPQQTEQVTHVQEETVEPQEHSSTVPFPSHP